MSESLRPILATFVLASIAAAVCASPQALPDESLAEVMARDGVAFLGHSNVSIGSFVYTNTDPLNGGSLSINGIRSSGMTYTILSVVNQAAVTSTLIAPMTAAVAAGGPVVNATSATPTFGVADLAAYYGGGDMLRIHMPAITDLPKAALMTTSIDSIRMGATTYTATGVEVQSPNPSFGSLRLNQIDNSGTQIFIAGRN